MNLQPLGDRLIVEVLEEESTTASGIVLPDTAQEKPQRGKVLAVGPGPRDEDGKRIKMDVATTALPVKITLSGHASMAAVAASTVSGSS